MAKKIFLGLSLAAFLSASASEIEFSYNAFGSDPEGYGYKKDQVYDVGIALDAPQMIGNKIVGLKVPVYSTEYVSGVSVWLSKELTATKGTLTYFTPDEASYEVELIDGELNFSFPEPYEIPKGGIYLGYSFTVSGIPSGMSAEPVAVTTGNNPGSLWLHASESQTKWSDLSTRKEIMSAMTVILAGDIPANAAKVSSKKQHIYAAKGGETPLTIEVENWGDKGISSFDYIYKVDEAEGTGHFDFEETIPSVLGRTAKADIAIQAPANLGEYNFDIKITKVNGEDNEVAQEAFAIPMTVQPFVATYRPLIEEYTGLRCGYCPRGYVVLEQMHLYHGDLFVGMAYHGSMEGDQMTYIKESEFPLSFSGYPAAAFNRGGNINPADIPTLWDASRDVNSAADIAVELKWADEEQTKLIANAKVRFINDIKENPYLLSFALLADGMGNPTWGQSNGYSDFEPTGIYAGPYWDLFIGKGSPVFGLTYNDVVVYYPDKSGIAESLPASIEADTWYEYTFEVETANVLTLAGSNNIEDFNKTRVIAMVVNGKNGKPLNCISSIYPNGEKPEPEPTIVNALDDQETEIIATTYYDMQGRRISENAKGIIICCEQMSDGTTRAKKIFQK